MADLRYSLLRDPAEVPTTDEGRGAAIQGHFRALAALAVDADCIRKALPDEHPDKRAALARDRIEKATLLLDEGRLEQLAKLASKLLRGHEDEERGRLREKDGAAILAMAVSCQDARPVLGEDDGVPILADCHGGRFVLGDVVRATRESAAKELLEDLRDRVLRFGKDKVEHFIRANDPDRKYKPLGWDPDFGPDEFIEAAPRLAEALNRPFVDRTDRPGNGEPLVSGLGEGTSDETLHRLRECWNAWRWDHYEAVDVTDAHLEELAKAMLRAMGADRHAVANAFRVGYQRETMQDRRAADSAV